MQVIDRVRCFIREHDLVRAGTRVLAAVSGGSDSVALAYLLRDLEAAGDLRLAGLAHFNHQLRPSAGEDERLTAGVARALDRPIAIDRDDVAARARRERRSIEDAARSARYEFFERARLQVGADVVALGHTRDDQAETVLLRLVRGAGPRGLAGMHPRHDRIVRPLLDCRRIELREWLEHQQIPFADDESNRDVSIPRNRVRAELLPLLETRFNPRVVDVLADEAELARELWAWMEEEGERFGPELDVARLQAAPRALARLVVWRAVNGASGGRPISFNHARAVLRLIERGDGAVDLPGQRVQRIGQRIVLTPRGPGDKDARRRNLLEKATNLFRYPLSIPGEVALPEVDSVVSAETYGGGDAEAARAASAMLGSERTALVRRDLCGGSLVVRNRRPGDWFRPVGLGGRKKLQDFFVDRKVARQDRDGVPIVVDETGRIVWVTGYGIDEAFRVTDPAQPVLILKIRQAR
ncbi:MAG: tRNA lysidine(34) synthetase TilS [Acidobacteria bacterium]|nr:tRNA lysidine(34) synthetase TilS [Acidobacteriota bacterium]